MKVLITTDWYAPAVNGVVTSVLNLQRELTALGHEVRVLTLSSTTRSYREGDVTYIGAVSAERIYPGARLRTAPAIGLLQEIVDWHPDIIHSQCEFSTFRLAKRLSAATGAPIVHTYHTVYEDYTHYFSPSIKWGRRAVAAFSRWVVSHTACVIAPTVKVREILNRYHVSRPVHVIPTGIDLSRFSAPRDVQRVARMRQELGIPQEATVLLYLGRLAEEKNIDELLRFLSAEEQKDLYLLLVGDGPYRAQLEEQVRALHLTERVRFAGMVSPQQVPEYYQLGDLFVSASTSETQGLTYIEALASGLPALCRQDPCLTGVIRDGINGWQFRNGAEFHTALHRFLCDEELRRELSQGAVETARQEFSAQAFAARVAAVYAQVLGQTPLMRAA